MELGRKLGVYVVRSVNKSNIDMLKPTFGVGEVLSIEYANVFSTVPTEFSRGLSDSDGIQEQIELFIRRHNNGEEVSKKLYNLTKSISSNKTSHRNAVIKQLYRLNVIDSELSNAGTHKLLIKTDKLGKHDLITLEILGELGYRVLVITSEIDKAMENNLFICYDGVDEEVSLESGYANLEELKQALNLTAKFNGKITNTQILGFDRKEELNNFLVWASELEQQSRALPDKSGRFAIITGGFTLLNKEARLLERYRRDSYEDLHIRLTISEYRNSNPSKPENVLQNKEKLLRDWSEMLFKKYDIDNLKAVLIYERMTENKELFIRYLNKLKIPVIVVSTEEKRTKLSGFTYIELGDGIDSSFQYPVDYMIESLATKTHDIEQEVHNALFNGANLGLHSMDNVARCNIVRLITTFDELMIYWNQKAELRPHFKSEKTDKGVQVRTPAFYTKLSGVNSDYKSILSSLSSTPNTILKIDEELFNRNQRTMDIHDGVAKFNYRTTWSGGYSVENCGFGLYCGGFSGGFGGAYNGYSQNNQSKGNAKSFNPFQVLVNGRLNRQELKDSNAYRYSILPLSLQEHILDMTDALLNSPVIIGFENQNVKDRIAEVCLSLDENIIDTIQQLEFYGELPKIVYVWQSKNEISLEDTILMTFLNILGFDIVLVVPTGYRVIENKLKENLIKEHKIGKPEFASNLTERDIKKASSGGLFGRIYKPKERKM